MKISKSVSIKTPIIHTNPNQRVELRPSQKKPKDKREPFERLYTIHEETVSDKLEEEPSVADSEEIDRLKDGFINLGTPPKLVKHDKRFAQEKFEIRPVSEFMRSDGQNNRIVLEDLGVVPPKGLEKNPGSKLEKIVNYKNWFAGDTAMILNRINSMSLKPSEKIFVIGDESISPRGDSSSQQFDCSSMDRKNNEFLEDLNRKCLDFTKKHSEG